MTEPKKEDISSGFGDDEAAEARRLITEIEASEKYWGPYWKRCKKILKRYQDDRERSQSASQRRLAILWSNTETLKPVCYAKVPKAVVSRRNKDADAIARIAAEVLERCINYSSESYDFDQVLKDIRDEYLLLAKGQSWTRYVPTFEESLQPESVEQKDDGTKDGKKAKPTASAEPPQPVEKLKYEEAVCDYVVFDDWGTNPARHWAEVRIVWRKVYLGRPALKKRFTKKNPNGGTVGSSVPLDWRADGSTEENKEVFGKAVIYEVWDKDTRKAYWVSKSFPGAPLDVRDDPLGLKDFFPCPKPALGTTSALAIIPTPDYIQYQDQAEELDELTGRIGAITKALRVVGVYAGDENIVLQNVFKDGAENKLIRIDGWDDFTQRGGLKGLIEWIPVEQIYNVLKGLYEAREDALKTIYEVAAIPDIMRGNSDPEETATAVGLKSTWGSSRVREKQKEMARFCRDQMNITGELIASKFSIETLKQMSGVQLLTRGEKQVVGAYQQMVAALQQQQQAQQQAQPAAPGQPPAPAAQPIQPPPPPFPPEKMELISLPAWEDVDELLKSDAMRQFRIDIESDSTIEPDLASDKRDATEYMTALGSMFTGAVPIIQAFPPLAKPFASMIKAVTRKFQLGTEVEEDWDKALNEVAAMPPQQPEPEVQKGKSPEELQIEAQKVAATREATQVKREEVQARAQTDRMAVEADAMNSQADAQTNAAAVQAENKRIDMEAWMRQQDQRMEQVLAMMEAQTRRYEADADARARDVEARADFAARKHEVDNAPRPTNGAGA